MKRDRRTVLIGAAALGAAVLLSARQGSRPACADGACGPVPVTLSGIPSYSWTALRSNNPMPVLLQREPLTNR